MRVYVLGIGCMCVHADEVPLSKSGVFPRHNLLVFFLGRES